MIATNLTSVFNTIKLAAHYMKQTGGGRIIATSSCAALYNDGIVGTPYMPAKAGVAHLVRQAAMELGRYNILVNAIAPDRSSPILPAVACAMSRTALPSRNGRSCIASPKHPRLRGWRFTWPRPPRPT